MELTKIKGNTYYINAPTNIGVFSYKNKNCLLFDSGINNSAARKIEDVLKNNSLHPKYIINTHSHTDHCGGNSYFKSNYTGCITYSSAKEKIYIENLELRPSILYSSHPVKELVDEYKPVPVDYILDYGLTRINDEKFEIIDLKGHSPEGIGAVTQDKVCFLGDAIFSESILNKYSFPNVYNLEESFKALDKIKNIDADYFVVSHAEEVYDRESIVKLADKNIANSERYLSDMLELLQKPLTKEELLESIIILNDLAINFKQYYLNHSSLSAFLAYLYDRGDIESSVENGRLYYYCNEK